MRKALIFIGIASVLIISGLAATLWFDREKLEAKLIGVLVQKVSPYLPFKIDSYEVGKDLEFLALEITFREEKIHLKGRLNWQWIKKDGIHIKYEPSVNIDGASEFLAVFNVNTERQWNHLDDLTVSILPSAFTWKKYGINFKTLSADAKYEDQRLEGKVRFDALAWTDPAHSDHAINVTAADLSFDLPEVADPTVFALALSVKETETLFGNFYLDLPLQKLPLNLKSTDGKILAITAGKDLFTAQVITDGFRSGKKNADVNFKLQSLALAELLPWATKNLGTQVGFLQTLSDYAVKRGTLSAEGSVHVEGDSSAYAIKALKLRGKDFSLRSAAKKIMLRGLDFKVDYARQRKKQSAQIEARELFYHHLKAKLKPTFIEWNADHLSIDRNLDLVIENIPLTIGKISAKLKPEFDLETSLKLTSTPFTPISDGFCLPTTRIPPMNLTGDFPTVKMSHAVIDPTGKFKAEIFGGKVELNELGIYALDTDVPETDFDVDWSGINLEQMGIWSKFGEIKGTLEGYAHDVVFQSLLPTQYHFLLNVSPYDKVHTMSRVEFSPEAMKNVVKVFTGADLDQQIPGIAGWLMFGWPSHVLGGYDVYYAGLKLTSEEGHIVVETLDKPGIFETEQKHFVLYGTRFKMPLKNSTYPLIVDATAMSNFVHQLFSTLDEIKQKKEGTHHEESENNSCEPPEL